MTAPAFVATPIQERLMDTVTDGVSRIIGFGGGIRGTKTWGTLATLITLCKVFPGSRWAIIRKDLRRLRDTTIPSYEKLRLRTGSFIGPLNQQTWTAKCANGSELLFRGENIDKDPELLRFHGYEVNGFLNEEADELSERTLTKEIERAGTWIIPGEGPQPPAYILNTFNPCANWPRRRFYLPWRDQRIQAPYAFLPTTQADNPYITPEQREAWTEMPPAEYKRFVMGDWESLTGAYYDTLTPEHLIDRSVLPPVLPDYWTYWSSFDWGYRHWAVACAFAQNTDGTTYLLDTLWQRGVQDEELAAEIVASLPVQCLKAMYGGHDCWAVQQAHAARGETVADVFHRHKIMMGKAHIDKVNGGRAVNAALKMRNGRSALYLVRTLGNLKLFDQLGEILPDELDIRKPAKVDTDANGVGGDDGADAFRYGVATRMVTPLEPTPHTDPWTSGRDTTRWQDYVGISENGVVASGDGFDSQLPRGF